MFAEGALDRGCGTGGKKKKKPEKHPCNKNTTEGDIQFKEQ